MSESSIAVTTGSGKNIHTWDQTISSVLVQDQFTLPGEFPYASYSITAAGVATNTADAHVLQIMAGVSNKVRIRRIRIDQSASATAATLVTFQLWRLTSAGTGGSAITARPFDTADAAASCTAQTLPSSKGTEDVMVGIGNLVLRQAYATTGTQVDDSWEWTQLPGTKPIIIPAGTANGLAIKTTSGFGAAGSVNVYVELVETAF